MSMRKVSPSSMPATSHSITVSAPVLLSFTFTVQPLPEVFTFSTLALVMIVMPDFLKLFSSCLDTSTSSLGTTLGRYSTMVTLVPKAL